MLSSYFRANYIFTCRLSECMPFRIVDHDTGEILLESPHVSDLIEYIDKNSDSYNVKDLTIS